MLLPNESGVRLTVTTHRQIPEAEVDEKRKRSIFKSCIIWESGRLLSQRSFPLETQRKTQPSSARPTQDIKRFVSHIKIPSFGNFRWQLHGPPGILACSLSHSCFRQLPGVHMCGLHCLWPCGFQGQSVLQAHQPVCPGNGSKSKLLSPFLSLYLPAQIFMCSRRVQLSNQSRLFPRLYW